MNPQTQRAAYLTRRQFFSKTATGLGTAALASMLTQDGFRALQDEPEPSIRTNHNAPKEINIPTDKPSVDDSPKELRVAPSAQPIAKPILSDKPHVDAGNLQAMAKAQQSTPPATKAPTPSTAADVTGTWNGTLKPVVDGSAKGEESGMLVLKQDGAVVTGTAGPRPDAQRPISNGKVVTTKEGTVVSFDLSNDSGMVMAPTMKAHDATTKAVPPAPSRGTVSQNMKLTKPVPKNAMCASR